MASSDGLYMQHEKKLLKNEESSIITSSSFHILITSDDQNDTVRLMKIEKQAGKRVEGKRSGWRKRVKGS